MHPLTILSGMIVVLGAILLGLIAKLYADGFLSFAWLPLS